MTQDIRQSAQSAGEGTPWDLHVLKNEHLRMEVLPALGGKLGSIALQPGGGELLQAPLKPYVERTATMPFDEADGSGWDECLPSIGPCSVAYGEDGQQAKIEDHGDFWRLGFAVDEATQTYLRMHAEGTSLPLTFERSIRLDGTTVHFEYLVRNHGEVTVPFGWSVHPLFAIEPYDRIHLPASVREVVAQASANGRLGASGSRHAWPSTTNALDAQPLDLALAGSIEDGVGDKIVLPSPAEGWCALERKALRTLVTMRFDPQQWPWLGLWICYGGWPEDATAKKGYTVALEPCNLPVDSLADALAQGGGSHIAAGETRRWSLQLEISRNEER